jgi:outer membrane biosynthesis protein TonB
LLAPRLLHQAVPAVPLGVASRIRTEVRLDVSVSVDGDGKVVAAHLVATQGTAAGLLAIEVLKAAQMSRFLPAEQDGKAVPGTIVLTFRFAPSPT